MQKGRGYAPPVRGFLGELACVSVLVGAGLKQPGRATLQIQRARVPEEAAIYPGPLAVLDCTDTLGIRGMAAEVAVQVEGDAPLAFADWVAGGTLAMTLTYANSNQVYQSIVPVSGLSVAECFEHYFDQSEQLPTHLWLAADESGAGALLLQKLPTTDRKDADGWARVEHLAASVTNEELVGLGAEPLLRRLFSEEDVRLYAPKTVTYGCRRNVRKVESMLQSLGREEVEATLAEQGEIVVKDDICNQEYRFGAEDVKRLFAQ
jgi:molecular chaperone Hsp33